MAFIPLRLHRPQITRHLPRFLMVGSIGFAVNASILAGLLHFTSLPFYVAQIIGVEAALLSNFLFHDNWTFQTEKVYEHRRQKRMFLYHLSSFAGAGVNTLITVGAHEVTHLPSVIDLGIGSAFALAINFLFGLFIVWRSE